MKRSKFNEEQITYALRHVESGKPRGAELRQLRSLEDENARLKGLVADLALETHSDENGRKENKRVFSFKKLFPPYLPFSCLPCGVAVVDWCSMH
jgi:hypothetical protein